MNKLYLFGVLFFFAAMFLSTEGKYYLLIDNFVDLSKTVNFRVSIDAPDGYWWNPYAFQPTRYPPMSVRNTPGALGGQRDIVVGWEGFSTIGSTCVANILGGRGSCSLSLAFVGGIYFQYDGFDETVQSDALLTGAAVDPAAFFNAIPGLGGSGYVPTPDLSERNPDGQTYDFTSGGKAIGFTIAVEADWSVFYYIDVIDAGGFNNSLEFLPDQGNEKAYTFRFDDPNWVTNKPTAWDWTQISGIQVRVWVFSDSENPGGQGSQAVDTFWSQLRTFGFEVTGSVLIDCECNNTPDSPVANEEMSIALSTAPTTILATTVTDGTGLFTFSGPYLDVGTYQVCVVNSATQICSTTPRCTTVTITQDADPAAIQFLVIVEATLVPPADQTIQCGACDTVDCLGTATLTSCSGAATPVTTFTDGPRSGTCASASWTRTFTAQGLSVTQTITIIDNTPPTLDTPASPANVECSNQTPTIQSWLASNGGAVASDCSGVTWTNDYVDTPLSCSGVTVTFTPSDPCGNIGPATTATYTARDVTAPTVTTPATNPTGTCNTDGSDLAAFQSWLNSNGGAVASDNCGPTGLTWSNNNPGTLSSGCLSSVTVTFTVTDPCGNVAATTGTYTIQDTAGPTINPQASPASFSCSSDVNTEWNNWLASHGGAGASDQCTDTASLTWSNDAGAIPSGCNAGSTVTFTVRDGCGNTASTSAIFTVTDTSPPTINTPAADATGECDGAGNSAQYQSWLSNNGGAIATDDCATSFSWTNNAPATAPTTCGAVTVTFTVTDACNNAARTTAAFRVSDTQPPTFTTPPTDISNECDGSGNTDALNAWLTNNAGATATDSCSATLTWSHAAQTPTGDGCNQVTPYAFSVQDACGNVATLTANFILGDTTPPVWECPVEDVEFECDGFGNEGQILGWLNNNGGGHAVDSCSGEQLTWTNNYPGAVPSCSSVTVTFVAADPCGNSISDDGVVAIVDTQPPTWSFFPDDVTVTCDADVSVAALGSATATDVCSGDLFVSMTETAFDEPADGNCPGDHIITRTWSAIDDCGNSESRDQVITVEIVRSSGPCPPEGCVCDDCCPPPLPSDCLPADCQAADCGRAPCNAAPCTCGNRKVAVDSDDSIQAYDAKMVESLPQCKPVYIYVNDDDDSEKDVDSTGLERQRMLVTNEPLHDSVLKSKSGASSLGYSVFALVFALALFFF